MFFFCYPRQNKLRGEGRITEVECQTFSDPAAHGHHGEPVMLCLLCKLQMVSVI